MTFEKYGFPQLGTRIFPTRNFSAKQIPDLNDKIAVVTGGTSGIGLESAIQLASHGADVIILGSSAQKGAAGIKTIKEKTGKDVRFLQLNLSSIKASQGAAEKLKKMVKKIDILIANAGVGNGSSLSEDGYEGIFALNHLGHFAFVVPLMHLFTGEDVRVVIVSSASHYNCKAIDYNVLRDKPASESKAFGDLASDSQSRYAVSKLANVYFARALQRRVGDNVFVNTLHPGIIRTSILDSMSSDFVSYGYLAKPISFLVECVFQYIGLPISDGALTQLYCATSPEISQHKYRGEFFAPIAVKDASSKIAQDTDKQEELWSWSEKAIKL